MNSLHAMRSAVQSGLGIAALPDYLADEITDGSLVRVLDHLKVPRIDVFFVYPEELRSSKRVAVFRDFLLSRLPRGG